MDHYIIFHLYQCFMGEKNGGINLQSHFSGWSKSRNLGPKNRMKYFEAILRHQMTFFGVKIFSPKDDLVMLFYTSIPFQK
jgi:hypothetical protein